MKKAELLRNLFEEAEKEQEIYYSKLDELSKQAQKFIKWSDVSVEFINLEPIILIDEFPSEIYFSAFLKYIEENNKTYITKKEYLSLVGVL